ncbi:hypothetical protein OBBRIDRAFT_320914 [Obba rivulosa]|uniref:Uncharacterized protein n=1 Tax=Obba rivulosa TaxID=1052685 RepID=A0A8E2DFZ5_9APHY|nr:hypothetical protein OBBRIDRAFT_320914 [Obba rivulosa]
MFSARSHCPALLGSLLSVKSRFSFRTQIPCISPCEILLHHSDHGAHCRYNAHSAGRHCSKPQEVEGAYAQTGLILELFSGSEKLYQAMAGTTRDKKCWAASGSTAHCHIGLCLFVLSSSLSLFHLYAHPDNTNLDVSQETEDVSGLNSHINDARIVSRVVLHISFYLRMTLLFVHGPIRPHFNRI